jgi:hypothetical protein
MSIRRLVIRATAAGAAALPLLMAGCVSMSGGDVQGARLSDNFQVYAPFDNERDWGPSYLVGAPSHHLGDESRVGDTRSVPPDSGASPADPKGPPLTESPQTNNGVAPQTNAAPPAPPQPLP